MILLQVCVMPSIPPVLGEAFEPSLGGKDCVTKPPLKGLTEEPGNTTILKKIKLVRKNEACLKTMVLLCPTFWLLKQHSRSTYTLEERKSSWWYSYFLTCNVLLDGD